MRAFTYILECADGTLYTGYTTDVERKLVYLEECIDKETAMSREWHIKQLSRVEKLKLIEENKVK